MITKIENPHKKTKGLHAEIKADKGKITVHFAENKRNWENGLIRIEFEDHIGIKHSQTIMMDAIASVMFTAYDPTLIQRTIGIFEHIMFRIKSYLIFKLNKHKNYYEKSQKETKKSQKNNDVTCGEK